MIYTPKQQAAGREMYDHLAEQQVLALMETLRRHDENWRAHQLMSEVCPYFLRDRPAIKQAAAECRQNVLHLIDPAEYEAYYGSNPNERPFEEQFGGLSIEDADRIPRVGWLRERLGEHRARLGHRLAVLDFGCNDGWMLAHLEHHGIADLERSIGIDLNPACVTRARERGVKAFEGSVEEPVTTGAPFDAVTCFEVLEHVKDPVDVLMEARIAIAGPEARDGRVYFSTPLGAVEGGLIDWATREAKGHVRAVTPDDVGAWLDAAGLELVTDSPDGGDPILLTLDADGLMLVEAKAAA